MALSMLSTRGPLLLLKGVLVASEVCFLAERSRRLRLETHLTIADNTVLVGQHLPPPSLIVIYKMDAKRAGMTRSRRVRSGIDGKVLASSRAT